VSLATLSHTICANAYVKKSSTKEALEWNDHLHATWIAEYGDIPLQYFVWLDKSGIDSRNH
jgi:hypothetical protein